VGVASRKARLNPKRRTFLVTATDSNLRRRTHKVVCEEPIKVVKTTICSTLWFALSCDGSFLPPRYRLSYFSISTVITAPLACGNTALIFTTLRLSFATHKVVLPGSPSADVSSIL
jgi:hypothetical protein